MRKSCLVCLMMALVTGAVVAQEVKDPQPPPITLGFAQPEGGPDPFGYTYLDSSAPGGPTFDWTDISGTGVDMGQTDDDHYWSIDLPFEFDFYGISYTQIAVGSNGTVYFEDEYLGLSNSCIPGTAGYTPQTFIAGYWDDLNPSIAGAVYYDIVGVAPNRQLIVQWDGVPHYGDDEGLDPLTFQVVLYEGSNNIRTQYMEPSLEAGSGATEGIQADPTMGLEYACNLGALSANLAICYVHPSSSDPNCSGAPVPTMGAMQVALLMLALIAASLLVMHRRRSV